MNSKNAFFKIDARILFQLGEQLVTDRAVALAELIKNSYDADGTSVTVVMEKVKNSGGFILVKDDGEGMNSTAFENNWMRIATTDKENNPLSAKYGRKKAGEKGIGRFACRRLSNKMLLKSVTINEKGKKEQLNATFTWTKFTPGEDVTKIPIKYSVDIVDDATSIGTSIYLQDTKDSWNRHDIRRLRIELQDLFTPDALMKSKVQGEEIDDPGFNVKFDIPEFPEKAEALDKSFYKNAWALLTGKVNEKGTGSYEITFTDTLTSKKRTKKFSVSDKYFLIKNVSLKCYIFSYRKDLFGSSDFGINKAQEIGRERGGIKVYSDHFRVFGYGRPGDDWLRVDYDRARSIENLDLEAMGFKTDSEDRPGLRLFQSRNLFGHVGYDRDSNLGLAITINRDSLIENKAFEELRDYTRKGIDFATVLYSNLVYQEAQLRKLKEEEHRKEAERIALAEKQKIEKEKHRAEEAARIAQTQSKLAEARAQKAEEERRRAQQETRKAEERRRTAEEERRKAEKARRLAEEESKTKEEEDRIRSVEEEARKEEERQRKEEEKARKAEETARLKAQQEAKKAEEERKKQVEAQKEVEDKRKRIELEERKRREKEIEIRESKLEEEMVLLRVLAATGTMMLVFQHELQRLVDEMDIMLDFFRKEISGKKKQILPEGIIDNYYGQVQMLKELGKLTGSIINRESRLKKKDWVLLPIVNSVMKPFKNYSKQVGANLVTDIPDNLRVPVMYRSELVSILHNLLTNSIKAIKTSKEKEIEVKAYEEDNIIHIEVLDSGLGLERDSREEVFSPFIGYSEPDMRFGTGTGLGLKIVRDMVRSYGGEIEFIDAPKDWQTRIQVKLPRE